MKKLLNKHKELTEKMQAKLGLSNYATMWLTFAKGMVLGMLLQSCL
jgi:hypothetical protein